eukprot:TRINITY_DN204_c0_g1_i1.p1 TRINITY_DN204_c0_g1~~TRINITY_DN204_c0_g1_i1.p1  ORF type:complete len:288 (+),score=52.86 TRINITY_DN204_c0_g1_i1:106-969(+)
MSLRQFAFAALMFSFTTAYWKPASKTTWHIQYTSVDTMELDLPVDAYNVDLLDTEASVIETLHTNGKKVICYFSAGSYEDWREDATDFPASVLGNDMDGWEGEKWLDIRLTEVLMPIMEHRMDIGAAKGCDAVDPDNVNGFENDSGFDLSGEDQLVYNKLISDAAHARNMSCSLKNDLNQIEDLVDFFDFQVNEQCHYFDECDLLMPFIEQNKAVFVLEYDKKPEDFCASSNDVGFTAQLKNLELDAYTYDCLVCWETDDSSSYCSASSFFVLPVAYLILSVAATLL